MPATHLHSGLPIRIDGRLHKIAGWHGDQVVLKPDDQDAVILLTQNEIASGIALDRIEIEEVLTGSSKPEWIREKLQKDIASLSGATLAGYLRRRGYINAIIKSGITAFTPQKVMPVATYHAEEALDKKIPSYSSLYRWYRDLRAAGFDTRALIPNFQKRGNTDKRLKLAVRNIIQEKINKVYLIQTQPPVTALVDAVNAQIAIENSKRQADDQLRAPHPRTIYREVNKLSPHLKTLKREGERAAFLKFNSWLGGVKVSRALERVEVDHTKLDIFVIDERTGLPIGRPWLTMAIDIHTGMPVGFHLGFDNPSWMSVMSCLRHAILSKAEVCKEIGGLRNAWDAHGVPEMLVVDNGKEFHSKQFEMACEHLNIHVLHTQARCPWLKGSVERFFGTLNKRILARMPGYTFSNVVDKGDYDPKKNAVMDMPTLKALLYRWIVDIYIQRVKRTTNDIPARRWRESVAKYPQRFPANMSDLNVAMYSTEKRVIHGYGIEFENIKYNSPELGKLREEFGSKTEVTFRYDPNDLGKIHVIHPKSGKSFEVPTREPDYASGLTIWHHKIIRRYARRLNETASPPVSLSAAQGMLIEAAFDTVTDKRKNRGRLLAHRFLEGQKSVFGQDDDQRQDLPAELSVPKEPHPAAVNPEETAEAKKQREEKEKKNRMGSDEDWGPTSDDK